MTSHAATKTRAERACVPVNIRWMIRRDMPEVLDIENRSFEFPWSEEDFIRVLRQRNAIGFVAEHEDLVVGFMIYCFHKNRIQLLSLAVHPEWRCHGLGRQLIDKLRTKLSGVRRSSILCKVRETNLDGQLFLKACGFRATSILRDFYDARDTEEDAIAFVYRHV